MDDRQELPFVDMALLADLSEVYVFFGGQYSWFAAMVQAKAPEDKIMSTVDVLIERFGKENVLGEIVAQNYSVIPHMQGINMMMQNVIDTYELQSFVSGNFHYVDQSHADAFEVALAIKDGVKIYDESRRKVIGDYHMMSESEIRHQLTQNGYMPDRINDLIETTSYIADRIDISIPLGATLFPLYEVPDDVA